MQKLDPRAPIAGMQNIPADGLIINKAAAAELFVKMCHEGKFGKILLEDNWRIPSKYKFTAIDAMFHEDK